MNVQERNSTKIYALSTGPTLPAWTSERSRRNLAKSDDSIRRRVDILQDFDMPATSSKLIQSSGQHIVAAGTYPPRIKCFDVAELSLKYERYVDAEIVDMIFLGGLGKIGILMDNRTIAFHAPYGHHYELRIPSFGRMLAYEPSTCHLLVASNREHVYRIDLEEGRFSKPYSCDVGGSCIAVSPTHALTALGGEDGNIRFWDNRTTTTSGNNLSPFLNLSCNGEEEVTSLAFDNSGMFMAVGTYGGNVLLYDMRTSKPLFVKEHRYDLPIHTVQFHEGSGTILSADSKLVKIWKSKGDNLGSILANVEGTADFTHFICAGDEKDPSGNNSGLILCAGEQPKMQAFYSPLLGAAPRWCSFLDSITEELEEKDLALDRSSSDDPSSSVIYEDYKFLTQSEIEQLGVQDLVGTPLLRGYMHGFFMGIALYNRIKSVAAPFAYEDYRKQKIRAKMEEKRTSRIAPKKINKKVVNSDLAERLEDKAGSLSTTKSSKAAKTVLTDDRFGSLFSNPDFEIDEENINFKLRNPSGVSDKKGRRIVQDDDMDSDRDDNNEDIVDEYSVTGGFQRVNDRDDWGRDDKPDSDGSVSSSDSSSEDEDGFKGVKIRGEAYDQIMSTTKHNNTKNEKKQKKVKESNNNVMYEADDYGDGGKTALGIGLGDSSAGTIAMHRKKEISLTMEERLQRQKEKLSIMGETTTQLKVKGEGSTKVVTFIPKDVRRKKAQEAERKAMLDQEQGSRKRRNIKELGFKTPFKNTS